MQTFSNMRRNSSYSQTIKNIVFFIVFFIYECLACIFVYLPPLLGVFFLLFMAYDKSGDFWRFCIIVAMLFVVEIFNDLPLGFLLVLFMVARYIVAMWLTNFNVKYFLNIFSIVLVYVFFYITLILIHLIFSLPFSLNPFVLMYYCIFEVIVVSIYEYAV